MELYPLLKLIHILSATVLFGTGLGTAFYLWRANKTNDARLIAGVARNVVLADWVFTTPSVILQPLTGFWLLHILGYSLASPWVVASLVLFVIAGACWLPVVWLQMQMRDLADDAATKQQPLGKKYRRYFTLWCTLGWPAFGAILVIYYLMIFRPTFEFYSFFPG